MAAPMEPSPLVIYYVRRFNEEVYKTISFTPDYCIFASTMIVESLRLTNFKNIEAANCLLSPKLNCFFGLNGMGKTNLLDALHYLSFVRSHLHTPDSLAVRFQTDMAVIEGTYRNTSGDQEEIILSIRPGRRKVLRRNKKDYKQLSEHIGRYPLVIVSPQDQELIQGSSEERRRFIDQLLSQQSPTYLAALINYNRALTQRNSVLKTDKPEDTILDILEEQMHLYGSTLIDERKRFVEDFAPIFDTYYKRISSETEHASLSYESRVLQCEGRLIDLLKSRRERDLMLGYTSIGPHRDDLGMWLGSELIRRIGSQGQRKTFLISLKLAQFIHLAQQKKERPILLLDDIFDKLDAQRMARIIELVSGKEFGQIFITDTNRTHLDHIIATLYQDYRLYIVENGQILPETEE